jgi:hypothetical protein
MTTDHEEVQEALAGYVLHSLDPVALEEAETLIATHVTGCDECRRVLDHLTSVAGDLALAAPRRTPPKLLGLRLRRELRDVKSRRALIGVALTAAGLIVAGLGTWNATLTARIGHAEDRQATSAELLSAVSHPQSKVLSVPVTRAHLRSSDFPAQLATAVVPGRPVLYVFGSLPSPANGRVYTVWLSSGGRYVNVAEFVPDRGTVMLAVRVDPTAYDALLITEEEEGSDTPSAARLAEVSLGR